MKKWGFVIGGYAIAFGIAWAAVMIRIALTYGPQAEAESGMYAFGDACLFIGVFGLLALIPTSAILIFLRTYRALWIALAVVSLGIALTGVAAALAYHTKNEWAALAPLRILGAPLLAAFFAVFAIIARHRPSRFALVACVLAEMGVTAYGWFVFFLRA